MRAKFTLYKVWFKKRNNIYWYRTWHDMIRHDMTWSDMIWHDLTWSDMIWHDLTWSDPVVRLTQYDVSRWGSGPWRMGELTGVTRHDPIWCVEDKARLLERYIHKNLRWVTMLSVIARVRKITDVNVRWGCENSVDLFVCKLIRVRDVVFKVLSLLLLLVLCIGINDVLCKDDWLDWRDDDDDDDDRPILGCELVYGVLATTGGCGIIICVRRGAD